MQGCEVCAPCCESVRGNVCAPLRLMRPVPFLFLSLFLSFFYLVFDALRLGRPDLFVSFSCFNKVFSLCLSSNRRLFLVAPAA